MAVSPTFRPQNVLVHVLTVHVALLLLLESSLSVTAITDLIEKIDAGDKNTPELHDFLTSVINAKNDFRWIRHSARNMKLAARNQPFAPHPLNTKQNRHHSTGEESEDNTNLQGLNLDHYLDNERGQDNSQRQSRRSGSKQRHRRNARRRSNRRRRSGVKTVVEIDNSDPPKPGVVDNQNIVVINEGRIGEGPVPKTKRHIQEDARLDNLTDDSLTGKRSPKLSSSVASLKIDNREIDPSQIKFSNVGHSILGLKKLDSVEDSRPKPQTQIHNIFEDEEDRKRFYGDNVVMLDKYDGESSAFESNMRSKRSSGSSCKDNSCHHDVKNVKKIVILEGSNLDDMEDINDVVGDIMKVATPDEKAKDFKTISLHSKHEDMSNDIEHAHINNHNRIKSNAESNYEIGGNVKEDEALAENTETRPALKQSLQTFPENVKLDNPISKLSDNKTEHKLSNFLENLDKLSNVVFKETGTKVITKNPQNGGAAANVIQKPNNAKPKRLSFRKKKKSKGSAAKHKEFKLKDTSDMIHVDNVYIKSNGEIAVESKDDSKTDKKVDLDVKNGETRKVANLFNLGKAHVKNIKSRSIEGKLAKKQINSKLSHAEKNTGEIETFPKVANEPSEDSYENLDQSNDNNEESLFGENNFIGRRLMMDNTELDVNVGGESDEQLVLDRSTRNLADFFGMSKDDENSDDVVDSEYDLQNKNNEEGGDDYDESAKPGKVEPSKSVKKVNHKFNEGYNTKIQSEDEANANDYPEKKLHSGNETDNCDEDVTTQLISSECADETATTAPCDEEFPETDVSYTTKSSVSPKTRKIALDASSTTLTNKTKNVTKNITLQEDDEEVILTTKIAEEETRDAEDSGNQTEESKADTLEMQNLHNKKLKTTRNVLSTTLWKRKTGTSSKKNTNVFDETELPNASIKVALGKNISTTESFESGDILKADNINGTDVNETELGSIVKKTIATPASNGQLKYVTQISQSSSKAASGYRRNHTNESVELDLKKIGSKNLNVTAVKSGKRPSNVSESYEPSEEYTKEQIELSTEALDVEDMNETITKEPKLLNPYEVLVNLSSHLSRSKTVIISTKSTTTVRRTTTNATTRTTALSKTSKLVNCTKKPPDMVKTTKHCVHKANKSNNETKLKSTAAASPHLAREVHVEKVHGHFQPNKHKFNSNKPDTDLKVMHSKLKPKSNLEYYSNADKDTPKHPESIKLEAVLKPLHLKPKPNLEDYSDETKDTAKHSQSNKLGTDLKLFHSKAKPNLEHYSNEAKDTPKHPEGNMLDGEAILLHSKSKLSLEDNSKEVKDPPKQPQSNDYKIRSDDGSGSGSEDSLDIGMELDENFHSPKKASSEEKDNYAIVPKDVKRKAHKKANRKGHRSKHHRKYHYKSFDDSDAPPRQRDYLKEKHSDGADSEKQYDDMRIVMHGKAFDGAKRSHLNHRGPSWKGEMYSVDEDVKDDFRKPIKMSPNYKARSFDKVEEEEMVDQDSLHPPMNYFKSQFDSKPYYGGFDRRQAARQSDELFAREQNGKEVEEVVIAEGDGFGDKELSGDFVGMNNNRQKFDEKGIYRYSPVRSKRSPLYYMQSPLSNHQRQLNQPFQEEDPELYESQDDFYVRKNNRERRQYDMVVDNSNEYAPGSLNIEKKNANKDISKRRANRKKSKHGSCKASSGDSFENAQNSDWDETESNGDSGDTKKKVLEFEANPNAHLNENLKSVDPKHKLSHDLEESGPSKCHDNAQHLDSITGHLASSVVDTVFERLSQSKKLHARFSPKLQRNQKMDSTVEKCLEQYKTKETQSDIKATQAMLEQIMQVMNKIIESQINKRTCTLIPQPLKNFLIYLTRRSMHDEEYGLSEGYPLPGSRQLPKLPDVEDQGDFLFGNASITGDNLQPLGGDPHPKQCELIWRKIRLIKKLLTKYDRLSKEQKIQTEDVHTYLVKHMEVLEEMLHQIKHSSRGKHNRGRNPSGVKKDNVSEQHHEPHSQPHPADYQAKGSGRRSVEGQPEAQSLMQVDRNPGMNSVEIPLQQQQFSVDSGSQGKISDKYKKLVQTAEFYRNKRQAEEKIGKVFSGGDKIKQNSAAK